MVGLLCGVDGDGDGVVAGVDGVGVVGVVDGKGEVVGTRPPLRGVATAFVRGAVAAAVNRSGVPVVVPDL